MILQVRECLAIKDFKDLEMNLVITCQSKQLIQNWLNKIPTSEVKWSTVFVIC